MANKKINILVITVLCFSVIFGMSGLAFSANQTSFSKTANQESINSRIKLLQMCAYVSTQPIEGNEIYNDDVNGKYLKMSDKDFLTNIRENLQSVISKQKAGTQIFWDKNFINELKGFDANLSNQLEQQLVTINKNEKLSSSSDSIYIPGTTYHDFVFYGYSASGLCIWDFHSNITWSWNTTEITSVYPQTYGQVHSPLWSYGGVVPPNEQHYGSTRNIFYVRKTGWFYLGYQGTPLQSIYPWLSIFLYAGGNYDYSCGAN